MNYVPLTTVDLVAAALLLLANGGFSVALGLRIEGRLAVAVIRMVVQLALVAFIIRGLFADTSIGTSLLVFAIMVVAATAETALNPARRTRLISFQLSAACSVVVGAMTATLIAFAVLQPANWYAPSVLVPVFGMLLGHSAASAAVVLDVMTDSAIRDRDAIELRLALGAPKHVAFEGPLQLAVRAGITPIAVQLAIAGLVTVPGLMAGQILAGVAPIDAAKYQIFLLLLIAGASTTAAIAAAFGAVLFMTDERHRLRLDRICPERTNRLGLAIAEIIAQLDLAKPTWWPWQRRR